jgi:hypothetical protein
MEPVAGLAVDQAHGEFEDDAPVSVDDDQGVPLMSLASYGDVRERAGVLICLVARTGLPQSLQITTTSATIPRIAIRPAMIAAIE